MAINKITQQDYTKFSRVFQLKLPLNIEVTIPKDNSVRLLGQIVEEMHLTELYQSYFRIRKNKATPQTDAQDTYLCVHEPYIFFQADSASLPSGHQLHVSSGRYACAGPRHNRKVQELTLCPLCQGYHVPA